MLHHAGRPIKTLRREGRQMSLAVHQGRQIYPGKSPKSWVIPQLETATVEDGGELWFEVYFRAAFPLTGSAATGWADPSGQYGLRLERSEDLTTWDHDFIPAPGYPIDHGDGSWTYAARSKYPIDSDVKSGHVWSESGAFPLYGDPRNNPFTSIILGGEVQALAHYPYTMPGHATQLQTDLRAVGWTGATVVATSDVDWRIDIPTLSLSERVEAGRVVWPTYLSGYSPIDGRPLYSSGMDFLSSFTNSHGVRTHIARQFCRLGFTHLSPP